MEQRVRIAGTARGQLTRTPAKMLNSGLSANRLISSSIESNIYLRRASRTVYAELVMGLFARVIFISWYDINMSTRSNTSGDHALLGALADFRYELRLFLHFSERAAISAGLQPQQHQLLLQVAGAPATTAVTIAYAAERLGLKHNSTVELVDRSEREDLLSRNVDEGDKRRAILCVTRKGRQVLARLSRDHARELNELAPRLAQALKDIRLQARGIAGSAEAR